MTDRELLELAAKAAGHKINENAMRWREEVIPPEKCSLWIDGGSTAWNPLTDDGDAFRLAVKLRIDLLADGFDIQAPTVEAIANTGKEVEPFAIEELDCGDPYTATRRAITRAAAEIGKAMPEQP